MTARPRLLLLAVAGLFVLTLSLTVATPARAEDAPPPAEAPAPESASADEGSGPAGEAGAAPAAEVEVPGSDETGEASGEPGAGVPAAGEQAALPLVIHDPIWCPTGVAPNAGVAPCSTTYATLSDLAIDFTNGATGTSFVPTGNGVIWITAADASLANVLIDGFDPDVAWETFSLTLKGGWSGTPGSTVTNPLTPSIINLRSVSIYNWQAPLTLTDITIQNASTSGACVCALYLQTSGAISLTRVKVDDNDGVFQGAFLDNTAGTGPVTITASTFTNNVSHGLAVYSSSTIALTDVTADGSDTGFGARLDNSLAPVPMNVTLNGLNNFNNNGNGLGDEGLIVFSDGTITAKHVIASGNFGGGMGVENASSPAAKAVTISGSGQFNDNGYTGLTINATGAVTLSNLSAVGNFSSGVLIFNVALPDPSAQPVTLNGFNNFSSNDGGGLVVYSDGAVKVSNVVAHRNGADGVIIDNTSSPTSQPVTVLGFLSASDNGGIGLSVVSDGVVTLTNLTTNSNGSQGTLVNNNTAPALSPKAVVITGTNTFNTNARQGLRIDTRGAVTLNSITANANSGGAFDLPGLEVHNDLNLSLPQNVSVLGSGVFNLNGLHGFEIHTYGAVALYNITANSNAAFTFAGGRGGYIENAGTLAKPVSLFGVNNFNENDAEGLGVWNLGAITLNNVTAFKNAGDGVLLDNATAGGGSVTVNGINNFSANTGAGLALFSFGAVKLSNATANNNAGHGILISNSAAGAPGVSLLGYATATGNGGAGLNIQSLGSVSAANLMAGRNGQQGAYIENDVASSPKGVTLTGSSLFSQNILAGLEISTVGPVALSNITATWNGFDPTFAFDTNADGVHIDNINTAAQPGVTLSGTNVFNHNSLYGLRVFSNGAVTLNNVTANLNGNTPDVPVDGGGVYVLNAGGAIPGRPVLINGVNSFSFNDAHGLHVLSTGAITLSKGTAYGNGGAGALLDNSSGVLQAKVTLTAYGQFERNALEGLKIQSNGAITAANLNVNHNLGFGAYLSTIGVTGAQAVTLTGTNTFNYNGNGGSESGLLLVTDGAITISNITASYNYFFGASLDNYSYWGPFLAASVTLTGFGDFTDNLTGGGLMVDTPGNVTLNRVRSDLNGDGTSDHGIRILANGNVTLVCSSAFDNFGDGLNVSNATGGDGALTLTLKGFSALNNNDDEDFQLLAAGDLPVRLTCP